MPAPVFISYARADRQAADAVRASLESGGLTAWIDHRDVEIGMSYAESIAAAISRASALALVLSPTSAQSAHVEREVAAAGQRGIPVFVYREQDVDVPESLRLYVTPPAPFRADVPREERVADFTRDVAAPLHGGVVRRAAAAVPFQRIADRLRRTASRHLRAAAALGIAAAAMCLLIDAAAVVEEWMPHPERWTATIEVIDTEDYVASSAIVCFGAVFFAAFVVRSWALAVAAARALAGQAAPETIDRPVFSARHPLQPRAATKASVMDAASGPAPPSLELWWPAMLGSLVLSVVVVALALSPMPAAAVILLLVLSHVLALIAFVCLIRMAAFGASPEPSPTPAAGVADTVRA